LLYENFNKKAGKAGRLSSLPDFKTLGENGRRVFIWIYRKYSLRLSCCPRICRGWGEACGGTQGTFTRI